MEFLFWKPFYQDLLGSDWVSFLLILGKFGSLTGFILNSKEEPKLLETNSLG